LERTPTRFGRVNLDLEPLAARGWKLNVELEPAQRPQTVEIPISIAGRRFDHVVGADARTENGKIMIDPRASQRVAFWS
jgi:hypothetical protein